MCFISLWMLLEQCSPKGYSWTLPFLLYDRCRRYRISVYNFTTIKKVVILPRHLVTRFVRKNFVSPELPQRGGHHILVSSGDEFLHFLLIPGPSLEILSILYLFTKITFLKVTHGYELSPSHVCTSIQNSLRIHHELLSFFDFFCSIIIILCNK